MILTIAHQKGGVGKTTLALNLAYCFADSWKVGIADTDVQGSVTGLEGLLSGIDIVDLDKALKGQLPEYDLIIIDTPPYLTNRLAELFAVSDYVLIPTKAGFLDVMAIKATLALLDQAKTKRPDLKAGIVMNMVLPRTTVNDEVKEILSGYGFPVHPTMITQRISYTRSPITNGVFGGEDEKAKNEVTNLATEIMESLQA